MGQEKVTNEMDEGKSLDTSIPDFYVNEVGFVVSVYDVKINFRIASDPGQASEQVAIVRMSPQLALAMGKLLLRNLEDYEERFGKINLPQDFVEQLGISEDAPNETNSGS